MKRQPLANDHNNKGYVLKEIKVEINDQFLKNIEQQFLPREKREIKSLLKSKHEEAKTIFSYLINEVCILFKNITPDIEFHTPSEKMDYTGVINTLNLHSQTLEYVRANGFKFFSAYTRVMGAFDRYIQDINKLLLKIENHYNQELHDEAIKSVANFPRPDLIKYFKDSINEVIQLHYKNTGVRLFKEEERISNESIKKVLADKLDLEKKESKEALHDFYPAQNECVDSSILTQSFVWVNGEASASSEEDFVLL